MKTVCRILFFLFFIIINQTPLQAQWLQTSNGLPSNMTISALAVRNQYLFAGTQGGGVYLSIDTGGTWVQVSSGLTGNALFVNTLLVDGSNLFAGTYLDGAFLSTNNGGSWTQISTGLGVGSIHSVFSFLKIAQNLYAGATLGVYMSTNNGTNWTTSLNNTTYSLASSSSYIFAGTTTGGIFRFPLSGGNWNTVNSGLPTNAEVDALLVSNQNLFAGIYPSSIYFSTNNGDSWTNISSGLPNPPTNISIYTLLNYGQCIFTGTSTGTGNRSGIYVSTNAGSSWILIDSGLPNASSVPTLVVSGSYLFAGLGYSNGASGVWRRPLSEMTTGVEDGGKVNLTHFFLKQNYPNPFNPTTNISFELPSKSFVSLKVFDLIGREAVTIVSEEMSAGNYTRTWNAENLSSGVYFYRLQAGAYIATKKLILLR